jgi:hypothetical protein
VTSQHNPQENPARDAFDYPPEPACIESADAGRRATLRVIGEPRPRVARMPWWFTAIKVSIAAALLVWVLFG